VVLLVVQKSKKDKKKFPKASLIRKPFFVIFTKKYILN
jgi:hypothetical protein